jgi:hypothetical protein
VAGDLGANTAAPAMGEQTDKWLVRIKPFTDHDFGEVVAAT